MMLAELTTVAERFGGFDGAIVQSLSFQAGPSVQESVVILNLLAYSEWEGREGGWKQVILTATDLPEFGWLETSKNTNLVLNYPVKILEQGRKLIVDFDPLHPVDKVSSFFIGGRELSLLITEAARAVE